MAPQMRRSALLLALLIATASVRFDAQTAVKVTARPHVVALASEKMEGRLTGSPGERLAAEYIVAQLKRIGARPLPGQTDYRLPFEFTAGTRDGGSAISVTGISTMPRVFQTPAEVQALSFSDNGEIAGP